jgi:hypothetical protein
LEVLPGPLSNPLAQDFTKERIAADVEKFVGRTDPVELENLGEDDCDQFLKLAGRQLVRRLQIQAFAHNHAVFPPSGADCRTGEALVQDRARPGAGFRP